MASLRKRITVRSVEALEQENFLWDTELRGFGVRRRVGGKYYVLKTRVHGQQRWFTIGKHGAPWTPDTARKHVLKLLGQIADNEDPAEVREDLKKRMTISQLCDLYLEEGVSHKAKSTVATDKGRIERHIKPLLGKMDVRTVKKRHVDQAMRDIANGKTAKTVKTKKRGRAIVTGGKGTATRTVGLLGGIFSFAIEKGMIETNPAHGVKRYADQRIERFLSDDELSRFGAGLQKLESEGQISPYAASAIKLLLFTGARKMEILGLKWDWVDFERSMVFLPTSKTGAKPLYLSAPALQILADMPKLQNNPYVFAGKKPDTHLSDLKRPWTKLKVIASLKNLRLHDLRHHFASVGAMGGLSLPIIGKLLGHMRSETTNRYSHLADDPVRLANEKIGASLSKSVVVVAVNQNKGSAGQE